MLYAVNGTVCSKFSSVCDFAVCDKFLFLFMLYSQFVRYLVSDMYFYLAFIPFRLCLHFYTIYYFCLLTNKHSIKNGIIHGSHWVLFKLTVTQIGVKNERLKSCDVINMCIFNCEQISTVKASSGKGLGACNASSRVSCDKMVTGVLWTLRINMFWSDWPDCSTSRRFTCWTLLWSVCNLL